MMNPPCGALRFLCVFHGGGNLFTLIEIAHVRKCQPRKLLLIRRILFPHVLFENTDLRPLLIVVAVQSEVILFLMHSDVCIGDVVRRFLALRCPLTYSLERAMVFHPDSAAVGCVAEPWRRDTSGQGQRV